MPEPQSPATHPVPAWRVWLLATRPKTLGAACAPVLMGTSMAFSDGLFHAPSALVALFGALLIQIATNFANDYYDFKKGADTADRLGPTRATQAGLVRPELMKRAFMLVFALVFLLGQYLVWRGGWPVLLIGLLSILFGILYTGGPYPLGYNGWADLFVLVFFGPVAVGGSYFVQALTVPPEVLIAGLAPGFISTGLLAVNNLRDVQTDRVSGKRTLAVRFGVAAVRAEYLLAMLIAFAVPPWLVWRSGSHYGVLICLAGLALAIPASIRVLKLAATPLLNDVLATTGKLLFIYGLLFSAGWALS